MNATDDTLRLLAQKYERKEFIVGDPSWWMHQVSGNTSKELLAFIAASLSYGSRRQFMPKIQLLLDSVNATSNGDVSLWLRNGLFEAVVPPTPLCFYRLYTCQSFNSFLHRLAEMVKHYGSIRGYLCAHMQSHETIEAIELLCRWFGGNTPVIPKDSRSSCKRLCMFLRWMVRTGSPVDIGIWHDFIDCRSLIIPMDTHVVQEALLLGLISSRSSSMSNAQRLTKRMALVWPDDPTKGDFALFGLGIEKTNN